MTFAHDTDLFLRGTAALVNTLSDGIDELASRAGLQAYLEESGWSGTVLGTDAELASVRTLRERLRRFWTITDRDAAAAYVNDLLDETGARPYLTKHDALDWHLHLTRNDAPLADRI